MIEDILDKVREIFVGRHSELGRLERLWDLTCQDREHLVYIFLNAPGVGKTTLIRQFGRLIEKEGKGLFFYFTCNSDYDTRENLNEDLILKIQDTIREKQNLINNYLNTMVEDEKQQALRDNLRLINSKINKAISKEIISLNDINFILKRLATIIPIFFAADEIQEFQKLTLRRSENGENENEKETALHYFTRLLKSLMNSRILLVLSGTRYHILSQIGGKIGSPIREKVKPLIIQKFKSEEVNAYAEQVRLLIKNTHIEEGLDKIPQLLDNYKKFLFAFSGGHPRTIENITDIFLRQLLYLMADPQYQDYATFMNFMLPLTKKALKTLLFSKEKENKIIELSTRRQFSIIKKWLLNRGYNGQFLGQAPEIDDDLPANEEINDIIYELMNLGLIVQNGMFNYHLTSYFYFLAFLQSFAEPHEIFLRQVLNNQYFKLMCGYHSGFGYTFENVFLSALIIYGLKNKKNASIPLKTSSLRSLKVIKGKIKWSELSLEQNILYHCPEADAVDTILIQEKEILLIQSTTSKPPDETKINKLSLEIKKLSKIVLTLGKEQNIKGWFVSLFEFKEKPTIDENIHFTIGDDLIPILGKQLFTRLKEVKESF